MLAALATAAIPALAPVDARAVSGPLGTDSAHIVDDEARAWLIIAPQHAAAGAALDAEAALVERLAQEVASDKLPFAVLEPRGRARLPEGGHACIYREPPGREGDHGQSGPRGKRTR